MRRRRGKRKEQYARAKVDEECGPSVADALPSELANPKPNTKTGRGGRWEKNRKNEYRGEKNHGRRRRSKRNGFPSRENVPASQITDVNNGQIVSSGFPACIFPRADQARTLGKDGEEGTDNIELSARARIGSENFSSKNHCFYYGWSFPKNYRVPAELLTDADFAECSEKPTTIQRYSWAMGRGNAASSSSHCCANGSGLGLGCSEMIR